MPNSLYLATNTTATGKGMVALGVMELAIRRFERVVYFRPIVRETAADDSSIGLMRSRYQLSASAEQMAGVSRAVARRLLAEDRYDELIQQIQERFMSLQQNADFAVVEGTSFNGLVSEIEFKLNADIAINLGCAIMPIYSAFERTVGVCVQSILIGNDSFTDLGGHILATIVNQVPATMDAQLREACHQAKLDEISPLYFLPEEPLLRQPTLRDFQAVLGAELLLGDDAMLDREVSQLKVAAMQLPDFLERSTPGSLIITPGDRSDILAGCALACLHADAPSPVGVVLTGGLLPPSVVMRLMRNPGGLPIFTTTDDTFTAAKKASTAKALTESLRCFLSIH